MKKYFLCIYGTGIDSSVLKDALNSNEFLIGHDVRYPQVVGAISVGDVLLLSVNQKAVAYGAVSAPPQAGPYHWLTSVRVSQWTVHNPNDPYDGISVAGEIKANCAGSARDVVKEILNHAWAKNVISKI